jgi:Transglutaminase-like superfamily
LWVAYFELLKIDVRLRLYGFGRILERSRADHSPQPREDALAVGERYARFLDAAARHHFVRARCLHRSLALHAWLQRSGLDAHLRIGVQKRHGALAAHAWVEVGGQPFAEPAEPLRAFTPLRATDGQHANWFDMLRQQR